MESNTNETGEKIYNFDNITNATFQTILQQAESKIPHHLTVPPFMPEVFFGRDHDLLAIKEKLFSGDNMLLLVNGNGGVGKTSLASIYYHQYKEEYAHVAWVLSQKSICNALLTLAAPLKLTFEPTMPAQERLKLVLAAMANLSRPCLLVIDNANEIDDLKQNYQDLRRCKNFHLLITSRINQFEKAKYYHIEGLPVKEALQLFTEYYPKHTEAENLLFEQIHTAIGGNTLVVELLAKYLNTINVFKTNYTLAGLLADLQTKGLLGLTTTKKVSTDYGTFREEKPETIVAAMYDLSELTNPEKDLLFLFAILPAEAIDYAMIELLTGNNPNLEDSLDILVQKGWIERNIATNEFKCNPLVQEIVKKKNPKTPEDCKTVFDVLNEKLEYNNVLKNLNYQKVAIFANYAEAIVKSFNKAGDDLAMLSERIGNYYQKTGDIEKATKFYNLESTLFLELYEANPQSEQLKNGLAISYGKLGSIHQSMGHMEQALKYFEKRSILGQELYEANPQSEQLKNGLAISYEKLGDIHQSMGHMEQALKYFDDEVSLFLELFEANPRSEQLKNGLAISYSKLGDIHQSMGHMEQALKYFENDLELTKELYEANPRSIKLFEGLAISYYKLAMAYKAKNDDKNGRYYFGEWKKMISYLAENIPQVPKYQDWNQVEY
jgi:tetratricopeptide (TPR) repeat protein